MTCREFVEFLMEYLDGILSPDQREVFDAHMNECPDCVAYLDTYRVTVDLGKVVCEKLDGPIHVLDVGRDDSILGIFVLSFSGPSVRPCEHPVAVVQTYRRLDVARLGQEGFQSLLFGRRRPFS